MLKFQINFHFRGLKDGGIREGRLSDIPVSRVNDDFLPIHKNQCGKFFNIRQPQEFVPQKRFNFWDLYAKISTTKVNTALIYAFVV